MKHLKYTLMVGLFLSTTLAYAQPKKNDLSLAGGINLYYNPFDDASRYFSISVLPNLGVFLTDHLLLGAQVGGGLHSSTVNNPANTTRSLSYHMVAAPRVAYYFGDGPLQPYVSSSIGFSVGTNRFFLNNNLNEVRTISNLSFSVEAGAVYWLADHVGIMGFMYYSGGQRLDESEPYFSQGINGSIGVQYFWSR
ncbi:MAG: hypothetical protein AAFQ98_24370 [Bacteroidota bacterium]